MSRIRGFCILAVLALAACEAASEAAEQPIGPNARPRGLDVSLSPEEAARLAVEVNARAPGAPAPGFELSVWATGPLVADPIALSFDGSGRLLYTRTNRSVRGELDIREHPDWMIESVTFRTVEDRRAFLHRVLAPERSAENEWLEDYNEDGSHDWRDLTVPREQVYALEDTSGDGIADRATLLVSTFHDEHTDVAHGLLAFGDAIYVGVAPDLWRLRDTTGDGMPDVKESISHGYGVHIGFASHGLSGVTVGPDGRIYWAIGDVGLNVVSTATAGAGRT